MILEGLLYIFSHSLRKLAPQDYIYQGSFLRSDNSQLILVFKKLLYGFFGIRFLTVNLNVGIAYSLRIFIKSFPPFGKATDYILPQKQFQIKYFFTARKISARVLRQ